MKLFTFLSPRKRDTKVPDQAGLESAVKVEQNAQVAKPKQEKIIRSFIKQWIIATGSFSLICVVVATAFFHWNTPPFTDNTNPNRTVYLNKSDAGYGLTVGRWNAITEIAPGSAADLDGRIEIGDELLVINGVGIEGFMFSSETIQALLETRHEGVELVVAPLHRDPFWLSVAVAVGITLSANLTLPLLVIAIANGAVVWKYWETRGMVTRVVSLTKSEHGYGFTMENGMITGVTLGGPADSASGLKKGDSIVRVNGVQVDGLWDLIIRQIFNTRDNDIKLVVKRKERQ